MIYLTKIISIVPLPTPMASTILKTALSFTPIRATTHLTARTSHPSPKNISLPTPMASTIMKRICATETNSLYFNIIRIHKRKIKPLLDQWVQEGNKIKEPELQHLVEDLYDNEYFEKAAQVIEWPVSKGLPFSIGKSYVELGLIFRFDGLEAAENYFNNLNDKDKTGTVYRTLLKCYIEKEGLVDKCIAPLQKMMELGFLWTAPCYNNLLYLYAYCGQFEKIPVVLSDMKEKGVSPNEFSYRIWMHAYGARSDINSMELILKEMESQPHIKIDWATYATVANAYVKACLKEKALIYLKKCVEEVSTRPFDFDEALYIMGIIIKLGCLVKIGELKEAEKLFKEWEWCLLTPLPGYESHKYIHGDGYEHTQKFKALTYHLYKKWC